MQVYVEIQDSDTNNDDLVDLLLIDHSLPVAESIRQNRTGIYNFVTMDLTLTVFCEEKFGGSDCTQCVPGFTGPNCDMIDHCFGVNCSGNGEFKCDAVKNSFTCTCHDGYKGDFCEDIDCLINNCSGNGICMDNISTGSCNCSTGFTGRVCEININDCLSNPCHERGHCVDGVNNFTCQCTAGFSGRQCSEGKFVILIVYNIILHICHHVFTPSES